MCHMTRAIHGMNSDLLPAQTVRMVQTVQTEKMAQTVRMVRTVLMEKTVQTERMVRTVTLCSSL